MKFIFPLKGRSAVAFIFALIILMGCTSKKQDSSKSADFVNYISAYTAGVISKEAQIRIVLAKPSDKFSAINQEITADVLALTPKVKGSLRWLDNRTLLYTPEDVFAAGQAYQAALDLSYLFDDVPKELKSFVFDFNIISQNFMPVSTQLKTYSTKDLNWYRIEGELTSSDVADLDEVSTLLQATQNNRKLSIKWRQTVGRKDHSFSIDSIIRGEEAGVVTFNWNDLVTHTKEQEVLEIPALGDFKVMGVQLELLPEQVLHINFSDPLDENQNLNGLITIDGAPNPQYSISNTEVQVLLPKAIFGEHILNIYPGIKNIAGYALSNTFETTLNFEDVKPAVELIGSGTILPQSDGLTFPFKAVNLNAVDVYVLKIFSSNVPQFLQVNQLEGEYQLKRVGRPIAYKKLILTKAGVNLKMWNTFSLDLKKLVKVEPGAIYRVEIKFKQAYSLYSCDGQVAQVEENTISIDEDELNTKAYDNPDNYYWDEYYEDDYYDNYDYRERDNPCNSAYYYARGSVSRNILASNIALTVKGSDQGNFYAFVTDIKDATSVSGATVTFYNYQNQPIGTGQTSADGSVVVDLKGKPFLAVAAYNNQYAYLRVDDGSALSLSNFDISGEAVKKGLKGFVYAERGVWRPGDTVHTKFMLQDESGNLPQNHPVIFEVRNPEGKLVVRQVQREHVEHIYSFPFVTAQNAPTGFYTATVRVGGVQFYKTLRIETIKPNRLKINVDFNAEVLTNIEEKAKLSANWLTGAKASNMKADMTLQMRQKKKPFTGYDKFSFNDITRSFYTSETKVFEGVLSSNGDAEPTITLGTYRQVPGMLEAVFVSRVFEPGGDASFDRMAVNFAPYSSFVGLNVLKPNTTPWLVTDQPITVEVASLSPEGKKMGRAVSVQVYDIDWSWWWSSGRNDMGNYLTSSYARKIYEEKITTKNGLGTFNFKVDYPNWGNFLVRVCDEVSGHCASQVVYIDWPASRNRSQRANPGAPSMLTFSADKESYSSGDVAKLLVPTGEEGRLLISLETGAEVLEHFWVDAKKGQTEVSIPITEEMTPTVYAFVSYIQPHAQSVNDLPIRLYGVIPINVNNEKTKLLPTLTLPEEWAPEEKAVIKVSETNGKSMTYTIAVVDEGLLDITRFKTPNPWQYFYAREALGVKTWDLFDDVIGAFGGVVQKNFAIGGDQEFDPSGKKRLNRFMPVVKVMGPFTLKAGETSSHTFTMPNYIGSVRVMVVAKEGKSYGNAEQAVPVRKPLMVLATLPRVVGPNEKLRLPVQVFAMKDHVKQVKVSVKSNARLKSLRAEKTLTFNSIGDQITFFELQVADQPGKGIVDVTVTSGNEKATYQVSIDVRNPNTLESRKKAVVVPAGQKHTFLLDDFGMAGTNAVTLEASGIPNLNLSNAVAYLLGYPHGCIEQTVSKAFPQLFLSSLYQLNVKQQKEAKENVIYALSKLQNHQLPNGGFSLWSSASQPHEWASTYATHFMIEAKDNGFAVPSGMLEGALKYLKNSVNTWQPTTSSNAHYSSNQQAYRLYVLALSGDANLGAMNRLRNTPMYKEAAWRLAMAYILAGQTAVAKALMQTEHISHSSGVYDPTFGNAMRASSMYLEAFILLKDDTKAFEQARLLASQLNDKTLYSSQSTALALFAMHKFLKNREADQMHFEVDVDGAKSTVKQAKQLFTQQIDGAVNEVTIENKGNTELYFSTVQTGVPMPGDETPAQTGLTVSVQYKSLDGNPIDVNNLTQGTDFKAVVTIRANADSYKLYDMALTQVFPSGWEIINTRLLGTEGASYESSYTYRDIRDDRVYTYFATSSNAIRTFEVKLNAAYVGTFYLPGPVIEAMYYPEIFSRSAGQWITVRP